MAVRSPVAAAIAIASASCDDKGFGAGWAKPAVPASEANRSETAQSRLIARCSMNPIAVVIAQVVLRPHAIVSEVKDLTVVNPCNDQDLIGQVGQACRRARLLREFALALPAHAEAATCFRARDITKPKWATRSAPR